jgi:chloramphenicol-sensitive protein RarD
VSHRQRAEARKGLIYGLTTYGIWGLMPLYFRAISSVSLAEILAQRIVWCALLLVGLLTLLGRWADVVACVRNPRTLTLLLASAFLVAGNWLIYIYGVSIHQIVQTSLGYFINPLFSVLLGMVFFGERLRPWQWVALLLANVGLIHLIVAVGEVPWIALALAGSFGLYGLVRKIAPVDGVVGLSVETFLLFPLALSAMGYGVLTGPTAFTTQEATVIALLLASGLLTAIPLICFGEAARRLPLTTMGFLQYLAPSMQFLLAVILFEEPFLPAQQISFGCIWAALALFSIESIVTTRQRALRLRPRPAQSAEIASEPCPVEGSL